MPTQTFGINVIDGTSAVLLRSQISRIDDALKKDAILNAEYLLTVCPNLDSIHVIGTKAKPHIYKSIDLSAQDILKTESRSHTMVFAEDAEHCKYGTKNTHGYTAGAKGTTSVARSDADVNFYRGHRAPSYDLAEECAKSYDVLRNKYESLLKEQRPSI